MLLTKEVEVKPNGEMIQYYKNKGYDVKYHRPLMIKIEDLQKKSNVYIDVLCDMCKEKVMTVRYADYNRVINKTGSYTCRDCSYIKKDQTNIARYGDNCTFKSEKVKEKIYKTNLCKYGYSNPMQSPTIRAKANTTLCTNGTQKTSKQQLYLHQLYNTAMDAKLNFPISYYAVDICFPEEKLVIEYDGGGHDLRVTLGNLTQEEFNQREIIRNSVIKREGYKQMRIISSHDFLPSDQILLQMLLDARKYFSDYPNHSWIEFNIDLSILRNAEHKDGILYDYGKLRAIKEIA